MKELYFSDISLNKESLKLKKEAERFYRQRNFSIYPNKAVLLILDMQNFFLDKKSHAFVPSAAAIITNIKRLIDLFKKYNSEIIFTRHINNTENAENMGKWWRDILTINDDLSEITDKLLFENAKIKIKSQYDAFYKTGLEDELKSKKISQIIIAGVMTHLCCDTTSRSAFVRGFEVFFGIDLTATYNRDFHTATLYNLSHGFATPVMTTDIINEFSKQR
jgi:isochorismate hydrolase